MECHKTNPIGTRAPPITREAAAYMHELGLDPSLEPTYSRDALPLALRAVLTIKSRYVTSRGSTTELDLLNALRHKAIEATTSRQSELPLDFHPLLDASRPKCINCFPRKTWWSIFEAFGSQSSKTSRDAVEMADRFPSIEDFDAGGKTMR